MITFSMIRVVITLKFFTNVTLEMSGLIVSGVLLFGSENRGACGLRLTRSFMRVDWERRSEKSMAVSGRGTMPGPQHTHYIQRDTVKPVCTWMQLDQKTQNKARKTSTVNSTYTCCRYMEDTHACALTDRGLSRRLWRGRPAAAAGSGWTRIRAESTTRCQRVTWCTTYCTDQLVYSQQLFVISSLIRVCQSLNYKQRDKSTFFYWYSSKLTCFSNIYFFV